MADLSLLDYLTDTVFLIIGLVLLIRINSSQNKIDLRIDTLLDNEKNYQKKYLDIITDKDNVNKLIESLGFLKNHIATIDKLCQTLYNDDTIKSQQKLIQEQKELIQEQKDILEQHRNLFNQINKENKENKI